MAKIEVTDEMVRRLCKHAKLYGAGLVIIESFSRELLQAALSEPEEIQVSYGMVTAAWDAWQDHFGQGHKYAVEPSDAKLYGAIYRAMEATRRKEAAAQSRPTVPGIPHHRRVLDLEHVWHPHRRITDL